MQKILELEKDISEIFEKMKSTKKAITAFIVWLFILSINISILGEVVEDLLVSDFCVYANISLLTLSSVAILHQTINLISLKGIGVTGSLLNIILVSSPIISAVVFYGYDLSQNLLLITVSFLLDAIYLFLIMSIKSQANNVLRKIANSEYSGLRWALIYIDGGFFSNRFGMDISSDCKLLKMSEYVNNLSVAKLTSILISINHNIRLDLDKNSSKNISYVTVNGYRVSYLNRSDNQHGSELDDILFDEDISVDERLV